MRFAWDERKAAANRRKHGIAFDEAITAFDDPNSLRAPDPAHSTPMEERSWLIGESDVGVLVVVFTVANPELWCVSSVHVRQAGRSGDGMKKAEEFPFERARRVTAREAEAARKAIEEKLGHKRPRRGRPPKGGGKYAPVSIRLHPRVLAWAKKEAKRRGLGYQTVINEALLKATA